MERLFTKLRDCGKDRSKLQNFCFANIDEILNYLPDRILMSDGDLNWLFLGFSDHMGDKIKVVDIVLEVLRKEPTSLSHCGNIISRVCLELPRLPSSAVVRWCDDSVESIVKDTDINMIWRDVIPECLHAISSLDTVNNFSVAEYRTKTLEKLLQCECKENQLVQLTAMFKDIRLSRQEHRKVVVKICSYIRDISLESLPPLLHQLLKLCKKNQIEVVLAHSSHYFNLRLYSKLSALSQDSESTTMDVDDIEQFSEKELHKCLAMCIYYMREAAEPEALRQQLRAWPRSLLAREPFVLNVALAMVDKGTEFKAVCLDVLRLAIEQSVLDEIRRKECAWTRQVLPSDMDLDGLLKELTTGGGKDRWSTWTGLIHLSLALLGSRGPEARACAAHGATTLARLAKAHSCTAPDILAALADRLAAESSNLQYIECLRLLCKTAPLSVEPCPELRGILESCQPAPGADGVFAAVHPLINCSERLRDTLVMSCRKGLYSRDSAHRCLAASGVLTVLQHLRMATLTSTQDDDTASQCSQSYMSVLTVDVHASQMGARNNYNQTVSSRASKDTICHEMVSILRRCLGQDAAVKQLLYTRWYSSVKAKPGLHGSLLEMLNDHLAQYLSGNGAVTLLPDKCVTVTSTNAVLTEPIGHLLYLIAQLLQATPHEDVECILASQRDEENLPRMKLKKIMAELSKGNLLAEIDMEHLRVTEATVDSKASCIKVQQLLQVLEALVAHHVMQWSPDHGHADTVYRLYKDYTQLLDNTKPPAKTNKKGSKLNDTIDSVKSRKSQTKSPKSQKASSNKENIKKNPKTAKDKSAAFKPLPCLWDLKICYRILELLYSSDVPWSSSEQRASLRGRCVLHRWAARAVVSALHRDHSTAHVQAHAPRIAALLYQALCRFQDLYDFDDETALGCLEMFNECLNVLSSPKYNCDVATYLSKITSVNTSPAVNKATILNKLRSILFTIEHSLTQSESVADKRIVKEILEVLITVLKIPTEFHIELSKGISKIENHVRETKHECATLLVQLLATVAAETCETTLLDDLLKRLADVQAPGADDTSADTQSTQEPVQFPWMRAGGAGLLRAHVATHVLWRLACAKHTLTRARDLAAAVPLTVASNLSGLEKELKEARSSCVLQLCQLTRAVRALCELGGGAGGAGGGAARAVMLALRLLALAADLVRALDTTAAEEARLENLLELLGNPFTAVLRRLRDTLDGKLVPRLVGAAETFRSQVIRLDKKKPRGYKDFVSERIAVSMEIQTDRGEPQAVAADETRDKEDDTMDVDSDASTEVIDCADDDLTF